MLGHPGHCILNSATQGNSIAGTAIHASTCQWRISWEKIGQHFALRVRAECRRTYRRKTDSILSFSYTKFYPKNYNRLSLNYGTLLASHSAVPRPLRQLQCILAPPPDIVYGVWGDALFFSAPPLDPFGISGYGAFGGGSKSRLNLSSRNVRFAQRKSKTGFELDRRQSHLRDSTVAPPLPFPACSSEGLRREVGR